MVSCFHAGLLAAVKNVSSSKTVIVVVSEGARSYLEFTFFPFNFLFVAQLQLVWSWCLFSVFETDVDFVQFSLNNKSTIKLNKMK